LDEFINKPEILMDIYSNSFGTPQIIIKG